MAEMTVEDLEQHIRDLDRQADELAEESDRLRRQARGARVEAAKKRNGHVVVVAPPLEVQLRDFAMKRETFTDEEFIAESGCAKAKFVTLAERLTEEGKLAGFKRGRGFIYSWVRPDHEAAAPERKQAFPDAVPALGRKRGDSVAGTGGGRMTRDRHTDKLVREAKRNGMKVEKGRSGHIKFTDDEGNTVVTGSTPRQDGRAGVKTEKRLRDRGMI